jgi:hypothetical protein
MKKEEPSNCSVRGNASSLDETRGSLSRPGRTARAQFEKPALSLNFEFSDRGSGRCVQHRTCSPEATRAPT